MDLTQSVAWDPLVLGPRLYHLIDLVAQPLADYCFVLAPILSDLLRLRKDH